MMMYSDRVVRGKNGVVTYNKNVSCHGMAKSDPLSACRRRIHAGQKLQRASLFAKEVAQPKARRGRGSPAAAAVALAAS